MLLFENGVHANLREETLVILRAALLHYNYEVYDTHTHKIAGKKGSTNGQYRNERENWGTFFPLLYRF